MRPHSNQAFLEPIALKAIAGIGRSLRERIPDLRTCGDVLQLSPQALEAALGADADFVRRVALGQDDRPVVEGDVKPLSISADSFARELDSADKVLLFLAALCEMLADRLVDDGRIPTSLSLRLRYTFAADDAQQRQTMRDTKSLSRALSVPAMHANRRKLARALFDSVLNVVLGDQLPPLSTCFVEKSFASINVRGLGISASNFAERPTATLRSFFGQESEQQAIDDDDNAAAEESQMRAVLESPGKFSFDNLRSFRGFSFDADNGTIIKPEQQKKRAAKRSAAVSSATDDSAVSATKRPRAEGALSAKPRLLDGVHFCSRCTSRFDSERELAEHSDWHAAKDLSDELNRAQSAPSSAKKTTTTTAAAKALPKITSFFHKQ